VAQDDLPNTKESHQNSLALSLDYQDRADWATLYEHYRISPDAVRELVAGG
jgi:hypothetical protein